MAAYAAVISLKKTIKGLMSSCGISTTPEILESAYNETTSLQQVLERSNGSSSSRSRSSHERVDGLEGQIRDFAHKLEDVLEFHQLNSDKDEEVMRQEITSFVEAVKNMQTNYIEELSCRDGDNDDDDDEDDDAVLSRINDFEVEMVGHSSQFTELKDEYILKKMRPVDLWFYAFWGDVGTGRTFTAHTIFEEARKGRDKQIFDCFAWVRVGKKYDMKEVLMRIIAQVDNLADYEWLISQEDEKLSRYLHKLLEHRRYMIVLDDVDDVELVDYLKTTSLPDQSNGSIVFLTTVSGEVALWADDNDFCGFKGCYFEEFMSFFIKDESFSGEMEVAINMIIHNCGGLIIAAFKTFPFLFETKMAVEELNKIAADKQNPIFRVQDEIEEMRQIKMEMQGCNSNLVEYVKSYSKLLDVMVTTFEKPVRIRMNPKMFFSRMRIISVSGMAGIGKTTFVTKLWKDKSVFSHFDHRVWITLGQNYRAEAILFDILAQIYPNIHVEGDEKLVRSLCERLSTKRCLIVLDDLWSKEPLLHLRSLFPDIRGITLVTTRLRKVAEFEEDDHHLEMQLLDKEESWRLLHLKVFADGMCSAELEKVGRKIAEKCDGLPLLILTVADQLLKVEMSEEYWNKVASGKEKSVFKKAHDKISKALLPSYQILPQHLKPCFLYIGVFREKCEIPISKLTNLMIAEGFLQPYPCQSEEDFVAECLSELVDTSLVMVQRKVYGDFQMKSCRLHSVFWHLSNSQAVKNKFFHAMNCYDDCSMETIESQRRLCIRNSVLLGMKDVQESLASNTSAHSLLCVSPLHQYPVPLNFDLRLLRVMDALTIRLYEFPIEVVRLVHLSYLGLTCNEKLPTSISNLWMLQVLIVNRYMNIIKVSKSSSLLPVEIWEMKELKHLQIMGGCLPNHRDGPGLQKLSTLLDVSAKSCRDEVLKWMPNLKRLGILIELAPNDDEGNSNSFRCLNNIYVVDKLESLKCEVVNPRIISGAVSPPAPVSMFPPSLKELSLSGMGYPWEYMSILGKLENLEVLKLKCYAFQGPKWEVDLTSFTFKKLKFLLVEDTNLVQWKFNLFFGYTLEFLFIKHCYKLQELSAAFANTLRKIEIVDCSPLTETWAAQIGEQLGPKCEVSVHKSWCADSRKE